ncbi:MAG: class I SAM-dependent methyltransferase [Bacteroidia bacterium]|nr:class I SAM-dependent methyltransferase [Bacteroidia bacterium]
MKRFHFFEFEDYAWFPKNIRDGGTDFLGFVLRLLKFYDPSIEILEKLSQETGHSHIIDLCSGSGGPISLIQEKIDNDIGMTFTLTDKFPNLSAYDLLKSNSNGIIDFKEEPLDLLNDEIGHEGIRTLFTAIHHFKPREVKGILQGTIQDDMPIAIFDGGDKHLGSIFAILITHPILFLFCTPFIRPFKWNRLLFTYIIPLIPVYAIWDGIVSILRLHTPKELLAIAHDADQGNKYNWSSGKVRNRIGFNVAFLVGKPRL